MKLDKNVKENLEYKNGFLVTCLCSILLLLTLCYFGVNSGSKGTHSYLNSSGINQLDFTSYTCDDGEVLGSWYSCGDYDGDGNVDCNVLENKCISYYGTSSTCQMVDSVWTEDDPEAGMSTLTARYISDNCFSNTMSSSNPNGEEYSKFYDEQCVLKSQSTSSMYKKCTRGSDVEYCLTSDGYDPLTLGITGYCTAYTSQSYTCEDLLIDYYSCSEASYDSAEVGSISCTYTYDKPADPVTATEVSITKSSGCPCPSDSWTESSTDATKCIQTIEETSDIYNKFALGGMETCPTGFELVGSSCRVNKLKYSISYDLSGGTTSASYPTSAVGEEEIVLTTNPTKKVTVTGNALNTGAAIGSAVFVTQTFAGWSYSTTGDTSLAQYAVQTGNTYVYADFVENAVQKSTRFKNLNATYGGSVTMTAHWDDTTLVLPTIVKTGYTCTWNTSSAGTGTSYASGATYNVTSTTPANINLYAVCTSNGTSTPTEYTVTLNANGGMLANNSLSTYSFDVTAGSSTTLLSATRDGYTFNGWYTAASGGTKVGVSGDSYTPTGNITLYAQWTASGSTTTKYTVTLDGNGGTVYGNTETEIDIEVAAGDSINYLYPATWSGYTFNGWYTAKSGGEYIGSTGGSYTPDGDITLYAQWTANSSSSTPNTCSGSVSNDNTTVWTQSSCNDTYINGKLYVWSSSQSCCLIRDVYYINYAYNGGTAGANAPKSGVVEYGSLPSTIISSTKYDYVLISKPTKTIKITGNKNGTSATVGNATSKAQTFAGWTFNGSTSTAKYGTSSSSITTSWSNNSTKVTAEYFKGLSSTSGATVKMTANWTPVALNVPTLTSPTGYTCKWNTKSDGTGDTYESGAIYTPTSTVESSISLYAVCEANSSGGTITKTAIIPTAADYCKTGLVYNGTSQTLTKTAGTGYTFSNNTRKDAGSQIITATLSSGYAWSDGTTGTKKFYCNIDKATPTLSLSQYSVILTTSETSSISYGYDGDADLYCSSNDTSVAVCEIKNGKLVITPKTVGSTEIALLANEGDNYKASLQKVSVIVTESTSSGETPSNKTFTATFNQNGGTLNGSNNKSCTTEGTSCEITGLPTATRDGYTFKGWGSGSTCDSGATDKLTLRGDATYYACWSKNGATDTPNVNNEGNVEENVQTGDIAIALVWFFGLFAIGYAFYYFKNIKQN